MKDWLATGGGAQDVLDEPQLFNAVQAFLDGPPDGVPTFDFPPVQQAFEALIETRKAMQFAFVSQVQRPTNPLRHQPQRNQGGSRSAKKRNMITRDLPDLDRMDPEGFVDNLEGMASAAFSNLTEEVCRSLLIAFGSDDLSLRTSTSLQIFWKCNLQIERVGSHLEKQSQTKKWSRSRRSTLIYSK